MMAVLGVVAQPIRRCLTSADRLSIGAQADEPIVHRMGQNKSVAVDERVGARRSPGEDRGGR
jgi:hypothetical protein